MDNYEAYKKAFHDPGLAKLCREFELYIKNKTIITYNKGDFLDLWIKIKDFTSESRSFFKNLPPTEITTLTKALEQFVWSASLVEKTLKGGYYFDSKNTQLDEIEKQKGINTVIDKKEEIHKEISNRQSKDVIDNGKHLSSRELATKTSTPKIYLTLFSLRNLFIHNYNIIYNALEHYKKLDELGLVLNQLTTLFAGLGEFATLKPAPF